MALPRFEVKLEAGDTRAALLEKKLRAELSFREVSEDYHVVWLNCRDHSKSALISLEELKSLNLNDKIAQPPAAGVASNSEAYLNWIYESFERLLGRFQQFLQNLSQATGIEIKQAPLKAKKRVLEKAFYDYQGDYSRLVDICRGSGVADDLEGVVKAMRWVLAHCHVVRFKNRFCDGRRDIMARGGYRDILVNLELPGGAGGGFVFELQIHLRPLFVMKDEAHKVLDLARAVIEPTLLKLSLLDNQESHVQLVQKIKQLELEVSGLRIESAVQQQGQQSQGQHREQGSSRGSSTANQDRLPQEWKDKYEQLQQNNERLQHENERLKAERRTQREIPKPPPSVPKVAWWQHPPIKNLLPAPKSLIWHGEKLPLWTRELTLQPNDEILCCLRWGRCLFAITQLELMHMSGGTIPFSQITTCTIEKGALGDTLIVRQANGKEDRLLLDSNGAKFVRAVLEFAARQSSFLEEMDRYVTTGNRYYHGLGVQKDLKEAVRLYRLASDQGYALAQLKLGNCYHNGLGVEQDLKEAVRLYRLAADQGDALAQLLLGTCYQNQRGVEQDLKEAVGLYRLAAEQGNALAQFHLGVCYHNGLGVQKDLEEAVRFFRLAADQGNALAQFHLGVCYHNGQGVQKDLEEAVRLFRLAADQGDAFAQFNLGLCYDNGLGVQKDLKEAVRLYRLAAEQGNAFAQFNLGQCYHNGQGVQKDLEEAVRLYRLAADQRDAFAQNNLGFCYYNGLGVQKDLEEAVRLYRLAADQGNALAQNNLGVCYDNGQGVQKDLKEAVRLYRLAADQGYALAKSNLTKSEISLFLFDSKRGFIFCAVVVGVLALVWVFLWS